MDELGLILHELQNIPSPFEMEKNEVQHLISLIAEAKHIFVSGTGRSGLVIQAFANRLSQMGYNAMVVGEPTTISSRDSDLLIVNSSSASSHILLEQLKIARAAGTKLALVTATPNTELGRLANVVVTIRAQSKMSHTNSIQPMGAEFEQYSWLFFDGLVLKMMKLFDVTEQSMLLLHANIE